MSEIPESQTVCFVASYKQADRFTVIKPYLTMATARVAIAKACDLHPWSLHTVPSKTPKLWDVLYMAAYDGIPHYLTIGRIKEEPVERLKKARKEEEKRIMHEMRRFWRR